MSLKEELDNLFDGDDSNSNNIFDRITRQMKSSSMNRKIEEMTEDVRGKKEKQDEE